MSNKTDFTSSAQDWNDLIEQFICQLTRQITADVKSAVLEALIEEKAQSPIIGIEIEEGFLSRSQAAAFLHCSLPTLHRQQKIKNIRTYKIGRKVLFKKTDLLEATAVKSKQEVKKLSSK
jgi:excisionase family DNA binding protein